MQNILGTAAAAAAYEQQRQQQSKSGKDALVQAQDKLNKNGIEYIQVIDDFTASNRDLSKGVQKSDSFKKLCNIIEEELLKNEFASEVYESNFGYSFAIHSCFGIFWISYEGDVFRYFTTREDCLIFINEIINKLICLINIIV